MSYVERNDRIDTPEVAGERRIVERRSVVDPGQIALGIIGFILALIGTIAVVRCGIDGSLEQPVRSIGPFDQSAAVGLVELIGGLFILLSAFSWTARPIGGAIGVVLVIGGIIGAALDAEFRADVGLTTSSAVFIAIMGALAAASALIGLRAVRIDRSETAGWTEPTRTG